MTFKTAFTMAAALAGLAIASTAHADITVSSTPYTSGIVGPGTMIEDFNAGTTPLVAGFSFSGTGQLRSDTQYDAAQPAGDTSQYYVTRTGETATLASTTQLTSLSIFIGSVDSYNFIDFLDKNGVSVEKLGGAVFSPSGSNGDQGAAATNRLFTFDLTNAAAPVYGVTFSSTGNSFEFDNISASAAPEPAAWSLMILGVGGMGAALRNRRRRALAA